MEKIKQSKIQVLTSLLISDDIIAAFRPNTWFYNEEGHTQ